MSKAWGNTSKKLAAALEDGGLGARGSEAELYDEAGATLYTHGQDTDGAANGPTPTYGRVQVGPDEDHDVMQVYRYDSKIDKMQRASQDDQAWKKKYSIKIQADNEMDEDFFTKGAGQGY